MNKPDITKLSESGLRRLLALLDERLSAAEERTEAYHKMLADYREAEAELKRRTE